MHTGKNMSMSDVNTRTKLTHVLVPEERQMIDFITMMSSDNKAYLVLVYMDKASKKCHSRVYESLKEALNAITKQYNTRDVDGLRTIDMFVYTTDCKLIDSYQVYKREDYIW